MPVVLSIHRFTHDRARCVGEFVDVTARSGRDEVAGQVPALPLERSPHSTLAAASSSRSSWEKNSARSSSSRRRVALASASR